MHKKFLQFRGRGGAVGALTRIYEIIFLEENLEVALCFQKSLRIERSKQINDKQYNLYALSMAKNAKNRR